MTMATDLYDLTVPSLLRGLSAMSAFLAKAEGWAAETGTDPGDLLTARLYPDMAPLSAQIQRASDSAKGAAVRIGGIENVAMADEEVTFADLQARIARTVAFLEAVPADAMNGQEARPVTLVTPGRSVAFTGIGFALEFVLPNFYFHLTTAYAILRMKGVPLGKLDYLGAA